MFHRPGVCDVGVRAPRNVSAVFSQSHTCVILVKVVASVVVSVVVGSVVVGSVVVASVVESLFHYSNYEKYEIKSKLSRKRGL